MLTTDDDNLIFDTRDGRPVAIHIDSFATGLGEEAQSDTVILRLYHRDWPRSGPELPRNQAHQFALPATQAVELAHQLLALAAQSEKEQLPPDHQAH
jgi:hypothetical protein